MKALEATSEIATAGSDVAVGEIVRYRLEIRVSESTSANFQIQDSLPAGLQFLDDGTALLALVSTTGITSSNAAIDAGAQVVGDETTLAGIDPAYNLALAGAISGGPFGSGTDPTFSLGTLTNNDRDANQEFVVLEFNARVLNEAGNQDGTPLANNFTVRINGADKGTSGGVTVDVVEPEIANVDKHVIDTDGSTVRYEVTFSNTGSATAFETQFLDNVPVIMNAVSVVSVVLGGGAAGAVDSSAGNTVDIAIAEIPVAGTVTITYDATLTDPTQTVTNTSSITYTSLLGTGTGLVGSTHGAAGSSTGERTGSGAVNDYNDSDTAGLGTLGDYVWYDVDNDGVQDAGEPAIAAATVNVIWSGPDNVLGNGDDITIATATDANGLYSVGALPGGNYRVTVDTTTIPVGRRVNTYDLDGGNDSTAVLVLGEAASRTDVDFGYTGTSALGDFVWYDVDNDGVQDPGEPGIAGVDVDVTWLGPDGAVGGGDDVTIRVTTDANGLYGLGNLPAGNYVVAVETADIPVGRRVNTFDLDGGNDSSAALSLGDGVTNLNVDFGYTGTSALGDFIWYDVDNDGVQDPGEPGIAGVDVDVTWLGPDGAAGGGDDVTIQVTTDANGLYNVTDLPAGNYVVAVDTTDIPVGRRVNTYDLDGGSDSSAALTLGDGVTNLNVDFGYTGTSALGDYVWYDVDNDGVQDAGEPGISGVDVDVTWLGPDGVVGGGDDVTTQVTTDAAGAYNVTDLPAGNFVVTVDTTDIPVGRRVNTYDLDGGSDSTAALSLGDGVTNLDVDFGYTGTSALGDFVWYDVDNDGVQDAGEPGIAGVDVNVTWLGPDGVLGGGDDVTIQVTTDAAGAYNVTDLPAGNFVVVVDTTDIPVGRRVNTYDLDGGNDSSAALGLGDGETNLTVDFGYTGTSALGDFVWYDVNSDGVQDAGEPGIPGVDLDVTWLGPDGATGGGDDVTIRVTTDANGLYSLGNLPAGNYVVTVDILTVPPGWRTNTYDLDGGNDGSAALPLGDGVTNLTVDFGYTGRWTLGDFVWLDLNADGIPDPGEPGFANVDVTLLFAGLDGIFFTGDDVTLTTTTDANGAYSFTNLLDGDYRVSVDNTDLPTSVTQTAETDDGPNTIPGTAEMSISGADRLDVDFGFTGLWVLGDFVWLDTNGNGMQDGGEPGIANVTVSLLFAGRDGVFGTIDDMTLTTTTDAMGIYSFTNLPDGNYEVSAGPVGLPNGYIQTAETDDVMPGVDGTSHITINGADRLDVDFGYFDPTSDFPDLSLRIFLGFGLPTPTRLPSVSPLELPVLTPLPMMWPLYSGAAEPGSVIEVTLADTRGFAIGWQTVQVDAGGNWEVSFPANTYIDFDARGTETIMDTQRLRLSRGNRSLFRNGADLFSSFGTWRTVGATLHDLPHGIRVTQRQSDIGAGRFDGFNLRTYFAPAFNSGLFSVESVTSTYTPVRRGALLLDSVHEANVYPLSTGVNAYYYESLCLSPLPSGY